MPQPSNPPSSRPEFSAHPGETPLRRPHTAGRDRTPPASDLPADTFQAEVFYLQKQVQTQTTMVLQLISGERLEGKIEWYDRDSLKICSRSRQRVLIYKSAIKYIYKADDPETPPSGLLR